MARKPGSKASREFVLFVAHYEDGTRRSNRKVPRSALTSLERDDAARGVIEEQDKAIAEKSGKEPVPSMQTAPSRQARCNALDQPRAIRRPFFPADPNAILSQPLLLRDCAERD